MGAVSIEKSNVGASSSSPTLATNLSNPLYIGNPSEKIGPDVAYSASGE